MAFFDDFGKKVTQMGQGAAAKAKNLTDQAKLSGQINEEEKKISENYRKIGELFYSVRGSQELPEYQTLMDEIDASNERIAELKHQLQVAKGMAVCPGCGAEVSLNAAFCPKCGAKMPQPESEKAPEETADDVAEAEAEETAAEAESQEEAAAEPEAETPEEAAEPTTEIPEEAAVQPEEKAAEEA